MPPLEPTLSALLALQPLGDLARTGWVQRGIANPESIAAHVVGTAFVVLALGPRVEPGLDVDRAIALALVHDAPEALLGDLPRTAARLLPPGAKRAAEIGAARELLPPLSDLAHERFREYLAGETREARFARVCDRLQLGVRLVGYHRAGARGLEEFVETIAALDCSEFAPAVDLQREIQAALG
jgi:putative hydrolase of HD superfamily